MKIKLLTVFAIVAMVAVSCNQSGKEGDENSGTEALASTVKDASYAVLADQSKLSWKGTMIGLYSHTGDIMLKDGQIAITDGTISGGSFTVDMSSMVTTDDDALYAVASREDLIGHLQADDFFASATYPEASFVIKSMEGNTITGDLTIRGITHEEKVTDVTMTEEGDMLKASGKLVFDRQKYDVSWSSSMKDRVLSDDIELDIMLSANSN